jgi:Rieske Fe-S protein
VSVRRPLGRRAVVVAGAALAACGTVGGDGAADAGSGDGVAPEANADGGASPTDAGPACDDAVGPGAVELSLDDYPDLRRPGALVLVQRSDLLLDVWVTHDVQGCFSAVWRVCTHGACFVEPQAGRFVCPCHDSHFAGDGTVLQGPATRPLRRFRVQRVGEVLRLTPV